MPYPESDRRAVKWHNYGWFFLAPTILFAIGLVGVLAARNPGTPHIATVRGCDKRHCYEEDRKFYVEKYCSLNSTKTVIYLCGSGPSCTSVICKVPIYEGDKVYISGYIRTYERIVRKADYVREVALLMTTNIVAVCALLCLVASVGSCVYSRVIETRSYSYIQSDGQPIYGGL